MLGLCGTVFGVFGVGFVLLIWLCWFSAFVVCWVGLLYKVVLLSCSLNFVITFVGFTHAVCDFALALCLLFGVTYDWCALHVCFVGAWFVIFCGRLCYLFVLLCTVVGWYRLCVFWLFKCLKLRFVVIWVCGLLLLVVCVIGCVGLLVVCLGLICWAVYFVVFGFWVITCMLVLCEFCCLLLW